MDPRLLLVLALCACAEHPGKSGGDGASGPTDPARNPDSGELPLDSGEPSELPAYCRSLDPDWAALYTEDTDRALMEIIVENGLLGDPRLFVDGDGVCRRRDLPSIDGPLAQLGRALFFSVDLSGDRDVACASCHHPAMGGADSVSLSMGPGVPEDRLGADRVRGLDDPARIVAARNTPSVLNVAFWDRALMWDGRVEAVDPDAGFNGEIGGVVSPEGHSDGANLPDVQAGLPVLVAHEMASDWGAAFASAAELHAALAHRLIGDADWRGRFAAVCAAEAPPPSWDDACAAGAPEDLVTWPHVTEAIAAYERSMVFVDTPWSRFVQGDTDAIGPVAKTGALTFFRPLAEGGQHCVACHSGDFFTDEGFHAIATPQIGPGDPLGDGTAGLDQGRAEVTGDPDDLYAFRTPTLLNLASSAPYFHAGPIVTLVKAVQHYRSVTASLDEYFGEPGVRRIIPSEWCRMDEFATMPDCEQLYSIDATHGGDIEAHIDVDAAEIASFRGNASIALEAFLDTLNDPRTHDLDALSPWIEPDSPLTVTETSTEWADWCDPMVERPVADNLRVKGLRWTILEQLSPGSTVNSLAPMTDLFGVSYWTFFGTRFNIATNLDMDSAVVGVAVLETLNGAQRAALVDAFLALRASGARGAISDSRTLIFDDMGRARRGDIPLSAVDIEGPMAQAAVVESDASQSIADAYRTTLALASAPDEHKDLLARTLAGSLDHLPEGVYDSGVPSLTPSSAVLDQLGALGLTPDDVFLEFVTGYATWTLGPTCRDAFMPRQELGSRPANFYGFHAWADRFFFDLDTGIPSPAQIQSDLAELVQAAEVTAGIDDFDAILDETIALQRAYRTARATSAALLLDGAEPEAIDAAFLSVAAVEAELLRVELRYYVALWSGLDPASRDTLAGVIRCIEDPATQALRGNGGFDASGDPSCIP